MPEKAGPGFAWMMQEDLRVKYDEAHWEKWRVEIAVHAICLCGMILPRSLMHPGSVATERCPHCNRIVKYYMPIGIFFCQVAWLNTDLNEVERLVGAMVSTDRNQDEIKEGINAARAVWNGPPPDEAKPVMTFTGKAISGGDEENKQDGPTGEDCLRPQEPVGGGRFA